MSSIYSKYWQRSDLTINKIKADVLDRTFHLKAFASRVLCIELEARLEMLRAYRSG